MQHKVVLLDVVMLDPVVLLTDVLLVALPVSRVDAQDVALLMPCCSTS